jgi:hypothetical protein
LLAVGKIKSGNIHASRDEILYGFRGISCWT